MKEPSNYTTADRSNAITLGEFMVHIGMGEQKKGGDVNSEGYKDFATLLYNVIARMRLTLDVAQMDCDTLMARSEPVGKRKEEKRKMGRRTRATEGPSPKKPKSPISKSVKRK